MHLHILCHVLAMHLWHAMNILLHIYFVIIFKSLIFSQWFAKKVKSPRERLNHIGFECLLSSIANVNAKLKLKQTVYFAFSLDLTTFTWCLTRTNSDSKKPSPLSFLHNILSKETSNGTFSKVIFILQVVGIYTDDMKTIFLQKHNFTCNI